MSSSVSFSSLESLLTQALIEVGVDPLSVEAQRTFASLSSTAENSLGSIYQAALLKAASVDGKMAVLYQGAIDTAYGPEFAGDIVERVVGFNSNQTSDFYFAAQTARSP